MIRAKFFFSLRRFAVFFRQWTHAALRKIERRKNYRAEGNAKREYLYNS